MRARIGEGLGPRLQLYQIHCPRYTYDMSLTYYTKQTAVLSIMYLSAVGYVLVGAGIVIKNTEDIDHDVDDTIADLLEAFDVLFAGGFITTLFWVSKISCINTCNYKPAIYVLLCVNIICK